MGSMSPQGPHPSMLAEKGHLQGNGSCSFCVDKGEEESFFFFFKGTNKTEVEASNNDQGHHQAVRGQGESYERLWVRDKGAA